MASPIACSRRKFIAGAVSAAATIPLFARAAERDHEITINGGNVTKLTPYLLFDGTCAEAMEFYKACLGGNLTLTRVKDSPARDHMPAALQEKVLNAYLESGPMAFSASDWLAPDHTPIHGNTACMFLNGGNMEELSELFTKLSVGAKVTNPMQPTFFGTYGALNDRFGVRWMFAGEFARAK